MSNQKIDFKDLGQLRDELKLQAHLFKADAKDRWAELEEKWQKLESENKPTVDAIKEAGAQISAANELLVNEIVSGYKKIKSSL